MAALLLFASACCREPAAQTNQGENALASAGRGTDSQPPAHPDLTADSSYLLDPAGLAAWQDAADLMVVDVRRVDDFLRVRIPGSVNLPLHAVKTKAFLKERKILLVGEAYANEEMEKTCAMLREEGFSSVRFLDGGLNGWSVTGRHLAGDQLAAQRLRRLSPQEFERVVRNPEWLVVDVSSTGSSGDGDPEPASLSIPFTGGSKQFEEQLRRAAEAHRARFGRVYVLLADRDASRQPQLERAMASLAIEHLYSLDGGLEAYRAERAKHKAMLAAAGRPACRECGR